MARLAVHAVQFEVLFEMRHAQKLLERGFVHALDVSEAHVVGDEGKDLLRVIIGKAKSTADFFCHFDPDVDVPVKTNAVGSDAEGGRFAYVVQQRAPGQRARTRLRQFVKEKQGVHKDIALGMKLWRLLDSLHCGNFWQHLTQQTSFIEQQKSTARMTFGEHLRELISHALARNLDDLLSQFLYRHESCGLDGVFEPGGEAYRAQHAQLIFGKAAVGIANGANNA